MQHAGALRAALPAFTGLGYRANPGPCPPSAFIAHLLHVTRCRSVLTFFKKAEILFEVIRFRAIGLRETRSRETNSRNRTTPSCTAKLPCPKKDKNKGRFCSLNSTWGWGAAPQPEHGVLSRELPQGQLREGPKQSGQRWKFHELSEFRIFFLCAKTSRHCLIVLQADSAQSEQPSLCVRLGLGQEQESQARSSAHRRALGHGPRHANTQSSAEQNGAGRCNCNTAHCSAGQCNAEEGRMLRHTASPRGGRKTAGTRQPVARRGTACPQPGAAAPRGRG